MNVNSNQNETNSELLSKPELAKRLKKTTRTIENWCAAGYLPYVKIGKSVLFRWDSVLTHLEEKFGHNS